MKKRQMAGLAVMAMAAVMAITVIGCGTTSTGTKVVIKETDFRSDAGGRLTINNMSGTELAIFVGKVERGNFIGAIGTGASGRARSRAFDIDKIAGLPQRGTFIIRATTFEKLNSRGLSGITEEDVVYSGLVVYDKSNQDRLEHDIFRGIDASQQTFIHVSNYSKYVLELRLGSSDGEKVAVLAPGQRYKKIWLQPDPTGFPLLFYPTYIYLDPTSGEINAFTDRENLTGQRFEPEGLARDQREISFRGPLTGGPQYNVAFISFQNDTNSLLNFMTAEGNYKRNDRGTLNTSPGRTDIYQIDAGDQGKIYTVAGVQSDTGFHSIGGLDVKPGHKYQLIVTQMNGPIQAAPLKDLGVKSVAEDITINLFGE
jgi:hypothetical protein